MSFAYYRTFVAIVIFIYRKERYAVFKKKLAQIMALEIESTFVIDDPAGNSYVLR